MKYCEIYIKILTFENVNRCKMYFLSVRELAEITFVYLSRSLYLSC